MKATVRVIYDKIDLVGSKSNLELIQDIPNFICELEGNTCLMKCENSDDDLNVLNYAEIENVADYKSVFYSIKDPFSFIELFFENGNSLAISEKVITYEFSYQEDSLSAILDVVKQSIKGYSYFIKFEVHFFQSHRYSCSNYIGEMVSDFGRFLGWQHIYSPKVYEKYLTKEALLSAPAAETEDLGNGLVYIKCYEDPYLFEKDKDEYARVLNGIADHFRANYLHLKEEPEEETPTIDEKQSLLPVGDIYDKASWHQGQLPEGLHTDTGYIPAGMYLLWLYESGMIEDSISKKVALLAKEILRGNKPITELYKKLGGVFSDDLQKEEIKAFTKSYFNLEGGGWYFFDYVYLFDVAVEDRYSQWGAGHKYDYSSMYHVEPNLKNFRQMADRLTFRYEHWKTEGALAFER